MCVLCCGSVYTRHRFVIDAMVTMRTMSRCSRSRSCTRRLVVSRSSWKSTATSSSATASSPSKSSRYATAGHILYAFMYTLHTTMQLVSSQSMPRNLRAWIPGDLCSVMLALELWNKPTPVTGRLLYEATAYILCFVCLLSYWFIEIYRVGYFDFPVLFKCVIINRAIRCQNTTSDSDSEMTQAVSGGRVKLTYPVIR